MQQRVYELKKSGNSTVIRIPFDELKANDCAVGDKIVMSFKKVKSPRSNWFAGVSETLAQEEAELMNKDFANVELDLSEEWGDEW
ncbi:antitoxin [Shewanella sairae]|uniref:Antitoxin n=2 Tax=Shewanella sairae TaxID=190310 RepID=A0ABQ4PQL0_9GAMM|nr:antitoxin [Shewanella sairae]